MPAKLIDLTGERFGEWLVLGKSHRNEHRAWFWICLCTCNRIKSIKGCSLRSGRSTQCRSCARHREEKEKRDLKKRKK